MKLTIPRKLMGCFGAMLLLTLVLAYLSASTEANIQTVSDRALQQSARVLDLVGEISTHLANMRFSQRGVILFSMVQDAPEVQLQALKLQKEVDGVRASLVQMRPLLTDARRLKSLDDFEEAMRRYTELGRTAMDAAVSGQPAVAIDILKNKNRVFGLAMEKTAAELADYERGQMKDSRVQVGDALSRGKSVGWVLVMIALCLGTIVFVVVRKVTGVLRVSARGMAGISEQIHSAAQQISVGGASLAAGATEQAAALEETSASITELSAMTAKGAENSQAAANNVAESDRKMNQAAQSLEQMVVSMKQLDASSAKISRIIKVIDGIAFQTNILALNAAVEAARAGEAGAGFAVVADEVRNLAQRCAGAARETAELIEASVSGTRSGLDQVEQVTQAIQDIARSVGAVKLLVDEVSTGSQEQAKGIEQIARAVVQMETVTQNTAATAEESAAASQEMHNQVGGLRAMTDRLLDLVETNPEAVR
jgi:methyl-accepting chemotaxis protein/methyl-accepting chemotaxis protein-1 (serine sensor receptor)